MRKELEEIARTHPDQFNLWYTLDKPPAGMTPVVPALGQVQPLTHLRDWSLGLFVGTGLGD